jgi:hypothetical protein
MQPPKEIHIEVTEKRDYHTRLLFARLRNISIVLGSGIFLNLKYDGMPKFAFYFLLIFSLIAEIALRVHNKFFIVSIDVVGENVRVLYKYKGEKLNRELRGNILEFDFKIRDVFLNKTQSYYLRIMYRGKVVVKQYPIDNWRKQVGYQEIKNICILMSTKNWKSKGFNLFW